MKRLIAGLAVGLLMFGGVAQASDTCSTVDENLNVNIPCISVVGQFYQVELDAYRNHADPFGLYWQLGIVTLTNDNGGCASYDSLTMGVTLPCVDVYGTEYSVDLNHYVDSANPFNFYWSLGAAVQTNSTEYTATATAGTGGSVTPSVIAVNSGTTASFPVTTNTGYTRSSTVGGTCPSGTWSGETYTTGTITSNCSVSFNFTPIQNDATVMWQGREWQKSGSDHGMNWAAANAYCDYITDGGYTDWVLPTIEELRSLIVCSNGTQVTGGYDLNIVTHPYSCEDGNSTSYTSPTIAPAFNSSAINSYQSLIWSSTVSSASPTYAWGVYFSSGAVSYASKNIATLVRCVRGGQ